MSLNHIGGIFGIGSDDIGCYVIHGNADFKKKTFRFAMKYINGHVVLFIGAIKGSSDIKQFYNFTGIEYDESSFSESNFEIRGSINFIINKGTDNEEIDAQKDKVKKLVNFD